MSTLLLYVEGQPPNKIEIALQHMDVKENDGESLMQTRLATWLLGVYSQMLAKCEIINTNSSRRTKWQAVEIVL